ncbi:MAG: DUF2608 domain-containing protein [Crocinitomicaceae bacterium]
MTIFTQFFAKSIFSAVMFFSFSSFVSTCETAISSGNPIENLGDHPKDSIITLNTQLDFIKVIAEVSRNTNSLYVFDVDNTLLITNENKFGSDWWYAQTKENPSLKLNVSSTCLFGELTPLFYSTLSTTPVFPDQAGVMDLLEEPSNKTIALTSRGYSPIVASATELELIENNFDFLDEDSLALKNGVVMLNNVIYTKGKNKGVALLEYLEKYPFENIYYFDDSYYKVENVQNAFAAAGKPVSLYHMKIAPKIPYTEEEINYMKAKLCSVIEDLQTMGNTECKCKNP